MKKITFLLALVMIISAAIPAYAEENIYDVSIAHLIQKELEKDNLEIVYLERSEFNALKGNSTHYTGLIR